MRGTPFCFGLLALLGCFAGDNDAKSPARHQPSATLDKEMIAERLQGIWDNLYGDASGEKGLAGLCTELGLSSITQCRIREAVWEDFFTHAADGAGDSSRQELSDMVGSFLDARLRSAGKDQQGRVFIDGTYPVQRACRDLQLWHVVCSGTKDIPMVELDRAFFALYTGNGDAAWPKFEKACWKERNSESVAAAAGQVPMRFASRAMSLLRELDKRRPFDGAAAEEYLYSIDLLQYSARRLLKAPKN
jgi:hypothetical protein